MQRQVEYGEQKRVGAGEPEEGIVKQKSVVSETDGIGVVGAGSSLETHREAAGERVERETDERQSEGETNRYGALFTWADQSQRLAGVCRGWESSRWAFKSRMIDPALQIQRGRVEPGLAVLFESSGAGAAAHVERQAIARI